MATPKYTALGSVILSSTTSSITFGSIPTGYRDLVLIVSGQVADYDWLLMQFNGDTGSNYSYVYVLGDGTGSGASGTNTYSGAWFGRMSSGAGKASVATADIMDYSSTNKHKTVLGRGNSPDDLTTAIASRWANTSAINQIRVYAAGSVNFTVGTTFDLFGVK